jgi:hypothetical protein
MCISWIPAIPIQDSFLSSVFGKMQPDMCSGPSYHPTSAVLQNTVSELTYPSMCPTIRLQYCCFGNYMLCNFISSHLRLGLPSSILPSRLETRVHFSRDPRAARPTRQHCNEAENLMYFGGCCKSMTYIFSKTEFHSTATLQNISNFK